MVAEEVGVGAAAEVGVVTTEEEVAEAEVVTAAVAEAEVVAAAEAAGMVAVAEEAVAVAERKLETHRKACVQSAWS